MRGAALALLAALVPRLAAASPGLAADSPGFPPAYGEPAEDGPARISLGTRRQASRLLLEFRARELSLRIDSLWRDSLLVPMERLPRYRLALRAARQVLSEMETRISEMRTARFEKHRWNRLWTRNERTLFGLERFIDQTEGLQLPIRKPAEEEPSGARPGARDREEL